MPTPRQPETPSLPRFPLPSPHLCRIRLPEVKRDQGGRALLRAFSRGTVTVRPGMARPWAGPARIRSRARSGRGEPWPPVK